MAAVTAPGAFNTYTAETKEASNSAALGKDDFLKLLITQLKYQNPLEPMEDKDFIGQMASFSSLEQMQNLNSAFEQLASGNQLQQSAALIGKQVQYSTTDSSGKAVLVTGTVDYVTKEDNSFYLNVGSEKITMDQVTAIK